MIRRLAVFGLWWCAAGSSAWADENRLAQGLSAFHDQHWQSAVGSFIDALAENPADSEANRYLAISLERLSAEENRSVRQTRLALLSQTVNLLEIRREDASPVQDLLHEARQAEIDMREARWRDLVTQGEIDLSMGRLERAHQAAFTVIDENPGHSAAQQLLSELQSAIYQKLQSETFVPSLERFSLQGFYAYGQADYAGAAAAWKKLKALLAQGAEPPDAETLRSIHMYEPYLAVAEQHLEEDRDRRALESLFAQGAELFKRKNYGESLDRFRQVAIRDPHFPGLGGHLAQAEAAVEKERARRLGEEKEKRLTAWLTDGLALMEKGEFRKACVPLQNAVALDPSNHTARRYLNMAEEEIRRRQDPRAAQQHYEAGLVAYASGKLEEALREWKLTARLDPNHPKVDQALAKVQKELNLYEEGL